MAAWIVQSLVKSGISDNMNDLGRLAKLCRNYNLRRMLYNRTVTISASHLVW